ncbi:MAG: O-antigen ligase family protein [Candidatus Magasanikbacteria bacterium]|nr:O-antigen ligase family protein [Candidatus Magasanikbacteria bacterium]
MNYTSEEKKTRELISKIFLYAVLLAPLVVVSSSTVFPFIFPKAIFTEIVVGLLAAVMMPLIFRYREYGLNHIYAQVLCVYAATLGFSGIFAQDRMRAFWSNHERMTGVIFIWYTILFSLLVTSYLSAHIKKLRSLLSYLVGISVVVSVTGIMQRIDPTFLLSQGQRVAGTFGNPIYLGGFAAQLALVAVYLAYINRKTGIKYLYISACVIDLIAVYLSGTRSAVVGLACALLLIGIYTARRAASAGYAKQMRIVVIGVVIAVGILIALPKLVPSLQSTMLGRLTNISAALDSTGSTRVIAWQIAIQGFELRPIFGWGPENFYYVFNKLYNPKSLTFGSYETWFDHAHNAVFDVLVTQGFVGFLAYLAQYAVIFWMCYKTRSVDENENIFSVVLAGIFVLHFIHNIFVFDHPGSYVEFYAFGAIVAARYVALKRVPINQNEIDVPRLHFAGAVLSVIALVVTAYVTIPSIRQNYLDATAQSIGMNDLDRAREVFQNAISINGPHTADVLLDAGRFAQRIPMTLSDGSQSLSLPQVKRFFDFAVSSIDNLLKNYAPNDVIAALVKAQLLMGAYQEGDVSAGRAAESAFAYATTLSPDRQQTAYSWARLKLMMGDTAGAEKLLEETIKKEPAVGVGHWYLAITIADTEFSRAAAELNLATMYGYDIGTPQNRVLSGTIYFRTNEFEKAAQLFKSLLDDFSVSQWDPKVVLMADTAFEKTNQTEARAQLRSRFLDAFKTKK